MAKTSYAKIADIAARAISKEKLRISFEYIDWESREFFFHGMEMSYYQKFFNCISEIQKSREQDITQQTHPSLKPKSIFNTPSSIRDSFPDSVIGKIKNKLYVQTKDESLAKEQAKEIASRAFEVSISKNYGRIHGFVWNNTFHIVWFDPAHNLYPMSKKIKKHRDAATVRCFSPKEVIRLQEIIKGLQLENAELWETVGDS